MKLHRTAMFKMGGQLDSIIVPPAKVCGVPAATLYSSFYPLMSNP